MFAWCFVGLASAGQVFDEPVDLEEVLGRSAAIAIVKLETPVTRPAKIPVPAAGARSCGTYDFGVYRVLVVEVLLTPADPLSLTVGKPTNVFLADTDRLVELQHDGCAGNGSGSPIFASFDGDPPVAGAEMIVFLRWEAPYGWMEAVGGAWLAAPKAEEIREKVKGRSPRKVVAPAAGLLCVEDSDCTEGECADMRCAGKR